MLYRACGFIKLARRRHSLEIAAWAVSGGKFLEGSDILRFFSSVHEFSYIMENLRGEVLHFLFVFIFDLEVKWDGGFANLQPVVRMVIVVLNAYGISIKVLRVALNFMAGLCILE